MSNMRFLMALGLAILVNFSTACGSEDTPPEPDAPPGCTASNAVVMIEDNHTHTPHTVTISSEDVLGGAEKTYETMGSAGHTHTFVITADQFLMLQGSATVEVITTSGANPGATEHTHVVRISC